MEGRNKPLLFYSPFCEFSKQVIGTVLKRGMRDNFLFVDIHKYIGRIPSNIQKVPCLLVNGRHVFIEDQLEEYIEQHARPNADIEPYYHSEMGGGLSDSFSYLDDGISSKPVERSFSLVNTQFTIETPSEDMFDAIYNKKTLEAYRTERDSDIAPPPAPQSR
jgi:hypothetical protein